MNCTSIPSVSKYPLLFAKKKNTSLAVLGRPRVTVSAAFACGAGATAKPNDARSQMDRELIRTLRGLGTGMPTTITPTTRKAAVQPVQTNMQVRRIAGRRHAGRDAKSPY